MRHYNCVAIYNKKRRKRECIPSERKVLRTGFKESEDVQSSEKNCQVSLLFIRVNLVWIWLFSLDLSCRSSYCDVFTLYMWTLCGESSMTWHYLDRTGADGITTALLKTDTDTVQWMSCMSYFLKDTVDERIKACPKGLVQRAYRQERGPDELC